MGQIQRVAVAVGALQKGCPPACNVIRRTGLFRREINIGRNIYVRNQFSVHINLDSYCQYLVCHLGHSSKR
jgi:hypothetical protein